MLLTKRDDIWYPVFFESENRQYALGIQNELFGRKKLQVLHREIVPVVEPTDHNAPVYWSVIKEYVTYDPEWVVKQTIAIFKSFAELPENLSGNDWKLVADKLPANAYKYLEDGDPKIWDSQKGTK